MRVVGLIMARNCEDTITSQLEHMRQYCDAVVAVEDRSTDDTFRLLSANSLVTQVKQLRSHENTSAWFYRENILLNLLYEMAEHEEPTWVLRIDSDEYLQPANTIRNVLRSQPDDVAGIRCQRHSLWSDRDYPDLVPLMGSGTSWQGAIWRGFKGLTADQPMHNPRLPNGVLSRGVVVSIDTPVFIHTGWSTLEQRLQRIRTYETLDPSAVWNHGVPYDRGLLFGYALSELPRLLEEYSARWRETNAVPLHDRD